MVEIASQNPKRFDQIDQEIEQLRYVKSLIPSDEDLEKYGPSDDSLARFKWICVDNEEMQQIRLAIKGILSILKKQAEDGTIFMEISPINDAVNYLVHSRYKHKDLSRAVILDLVDAGYIEIGTDWKISFQRSAL